MATEAAGAIYDIGYQRYTGARLGRSNALRTLLLQGLRTIWGFGRGDRSKIIPFALTGMALVPAVVQAWVGAATGNLVRLVGYETYFQQVELTLLLLCAAQAPELVSTDQQNRVLPLYFSRPLSRMDYLLGKLAALFLAVFSIAVVGQLIILGGRVFANEVPLDGWREERGELLPILATSFLAALLFASVSLAVAAFLRSRARASAAIVGLVLASAGGTAVLRQALPDDISRRVVLANPLQALSGVTYWLFDAPIPRRSMLRGAEVPGHLYLLSVATFVLVALTVLVSRYRRLRT